MYDQRTKLVGQIVSDTFGDIVAQVAIDLTCFSVKTFSQILSSTSLSIKEVRFALSVLIKHRLVTFNDTRKPGTVDYQIQVREAFKKKTAKIVTSSLSGVSGVNQNPYNKPNYYRNMNLWRVGVQTLNSLL